MADALGHPTTVAESQQMGPLIEAGSGGRSIADPPMDEAVIRDVSWHCICPRPYDSPPTSSSVGRCWTTPSESASAYSPLSMIGTGRGEAPTASSTASTIWSEL